jgi:chromosome segregation ATPase
MAIDLANLEREVMETREAVAAYVERVAAKDAEQEAAVAALAERVRELEAELAGQPEVQARLEGFATELDSIQAGIAEPVPPPVPEPEPEPEPAPEA